MIVIGRVLETTNTEISYKELLFCLGIQNKVDTFPMHLMVNDGAIKKNMDEANQILYSEFPDATGGNGILGNRIKREADINRK